MLGNRWNESFRRKIADKSSPPIAPPICAQMLTFPKEKRFITKLATINTVNIRPICCKNGCFVKNAKPTTAAKRPNIEVDAPAETTLGVKRKTMALPKIPDKR